MRKLIIRGVVVLLPIFALLVLVNYFVDPAYVYHANALDNEVFNAFRSGSYITNLTNYNERQLKRHLVEEHQGDTVDFIVLGSSRVLSIDEFSLPGSVLNLGVSGGQVEDFISFYQICKDNNLHYKNVIIGLDPNMFNENWMDNRWKSNIKFYNRYLGKRDFFGNWFIVKNLFDVSYFQESLKQLKKNGFKKKSSELTITQAYCNEGTTLHRDGSICYNREYRETVQKTIDSIALNKKIHPAFSRFSVFSSQSKHVLLFNELLDIMQNNNKTVWLFTSPYHPLFFERLKDFPVVMEGMDYIEDLSNSRSIGRIGEYDPNKCGCDNFSFYDEGHPRKETVDRLFGQLLNKY